MVHLVEMCIRDSNEAEEKSTEQESESAGTQDKSQQQQEKLTGSELKEGGQTKKSTERNQEQSTACLLYTSRCV